MLSVCTSVKLPKTPPHNLRESRNWPQRGGPIWPQLWQVIHRNAAGNTTAY